MMNKAKLMSGTLSKEEKAALQKKRNAIFVALWALFLNGMAVFLWISHPAPSINNILITFGSILADVAVCFEMGILKQNRL